MEEHNFEAASGEPTHWPSVHHSLAMVSYHLLFPRLDIDLRKPCRSIPQQTINRFELILPGLVVALRRGSYRERLHLRYFVLGDLHLDFGVLLESLGALFYFVSLIASWYTFGEITPLADSASTTPDLYRGTSADSCVSCKNTGQLEDIAKVGSAPLYLV